MMFSINVLTFISQFFILRRLFSKLFQSPDAGELIVVIVTLVS